MEVVADEMLLASITLSAAKQRKNSNSLTIFNSR
jgi:hypothetical protein